MAKTAFTKPALPKSDLVAFLEGKGLAFRDKNAALKKLEYIGYYRLKIYTRAFEDGSKKFKAGTDFEDIIVLYEFDRKMRLICLDAIERLEVALRAKLIDVMGSIGGPHFYYSESYFENKKAVTDLRKLGENGHHQSIDHYKYKYDTPSLPPIWCLTEASTFGFISKVLSQLELNYRKQIATLFGYDETIVVSWFRSITTVRNICAHHGRLWNREMRVDTPKIAKRVQSELVQNHTFYARMVVIRALLNEIDKAYSDDWSKQLQRHIDSHSATILPFMGFPVDWKTRNLWL